MQFRPFEPGIEVYGPSIDAIIEGFSLFPSIALEKLAQRGIGELREPSSGEGRPDIVIDRTRWYPQVNWLSAFEDIAQSVGTLVMYKIGTQVPRHAPFPETIADIHSALRLLDVAFHMNHRKNGEVMFDVHTGAMIEGIGHYAYGEGTGARDVVITCRNPYPCDFDRGIIQAVATRYQPDAQVVHRKGGSCRKRGDDACVYSVSW